MEITRHPCLDQNWDIHLNDWASGIGIPHRLKKDERLGSCRLLGRARIAMAKTCKYRRSFHPNGFWIPECCRGSGDPDFHEDEYMEDDDVYDWTYCPHCGREIKVQEGKYWYD